MNVIYLSGGCGFRAQLGYPKQYAILGGKFIIMHGLELLQRMPEIDKIIIPTNDIKQVETLCGQYNITKAIACQGGETRQESVCNAIYHVESEYVLIAEAVRPFITEEFVRRVIHTPGHFVTPIARAKSSVVQRRGGYINRDNVGEVQMPQKYLSSLLGKAHIKTEMENATDDAVLVIDVMNIYPTVIDGIEENIKITTPLDLKIAEAIYEYNRKAEEVL